jgi:hypothetical protein
MPVNYLASHASYVSTNRLILAALAVLGVYVLKAWTGGRRNTWERDWTGKMILVVVSYTLPIYSSWNDRCYEMIADTGRVLLRAQSFPLYTISFIYPSHRKSYSYRR